jgi:aryl-alcohol dehydrogenase-like predicted oxidoreductase
VAAEAGVTLLDTADVYPVGGGLPTVGRTEEIVGRWLRGKRTRFVVATEAVGKVGPWPWDQGASRKHLLDAIEASLRRLGTDYVDLYQLHSDDRALRSKRRSRRSTGSCVRARRAMSASPTSSPTGWRLRSRPFG